MLRLQSLIFHLEKNPPKNVFFLRIRYRISHKISLSLPLIFGVRAGHRGEGWDISEKIKRLLLNDESQIKAVTFDN